MSSSVRSRSSPSRRCSGRRRAASRPRSRDRLGLLGRALAVARVLDRRACAGPAPVRPGAATAWRSARLDGAQAAVVHRARRRSGRRRGACASVASRKTPRPGGMVCAVAEQVLEHRGAGAARVGALADVRELLRVAEQHQAARRRPRSRARRRARSGRPRRRTASRPTPRSSSRAHSQACRRAAAPRRRAGTSAVSRRRPVGALVVRLGLPPPDFLSPRKSTPASSAASSISSSRLAIALCEVAATPTRFPSRQQSTVSARRCRSCRSRVGPDEQRRAAEVRDALAERVPAQPRRRPQQQLEGGARPAHLPRAPARRARAAPACWAVCGIGLGGISAVGSGL